MHPVGPLSPRVYWVRRVSVIVAAVAVLIAVIFVVANRSKGSPVKSLGLGGAVASGSATPSLTGVLAPVVRTAPGGVLAGRSETVSNGTGPAGLPAAVPRDSRTVSAASSSVTSVGAVPPSGTAPVQAGEKGVGTAAKTTASAIPTPARTSQAGTAPVKIDPASTTPHRTAPDQTVPDRTEPNRTVPNRTVPNRTAPVKSTPLNASSVKNAPRKTLPVATAPAQTLPKTTADGKPAPVRTATATGPLKPPAKPSATVSATAPPAPTTDAQGRLLCADSALTLTASTGAPSYRQGDRPVLGVSVTNTGQVACTRNLSGTLQVFTVSSAAGARMWSTTDCFPGEGTDVQTLAPGQQLQYNVKWSGTSSAPGCTAVRVQVPAGRYQVRVDIGSLHATPAVLMVN